MKISNQNPTYISMLIIICQLWTSDWQSYVDVSDQSVDV